MGQVCYLRVSELSLHRHFVNVQFVNKLLVGFLKNYICCRFAVTHRHQLADHSNCKVLLVLGVNQH